MSEVMFAVQMKMHWHFCSVSCFMLKYARVTATFWQCVMLKAMFDADVTSVRRFPFITWSLHCYYIFSNGIGKVRLIYRGFLYGGPSTGRHEVRRKKKTELSQTHLLNARLGRHLLLAVPLTLAVQLTLGTGGGLMQPPLRFFWNIFFVNRAIVTIFSIAFRPSFLRPTWKFQDPDGDPLTFDLWRHNWGHVRRKMRSVGHNLQTSPFLLVIWMWTCSTK